MKVKQFLQSKEEALKPINGIDGEDGLSAYELWLEQGNEGTVQDFLSSLKGADGEVVTQEVVTHEVIREITKEQPIIKTEIVKEIIKEVPLVAKDGEDGVSISSAKVNVNGDLIMTYSDKQVINAGHVQGRDGTNSTSGGGGLKNLGGDGITIKGRYVSLNIKKLPESITIEDADEFAISRGGELFKVTAETLAAYIVTENTTVRTITFAETDSGTYTMQEDDDVLLVDATGGNIIVVPRLAAVTNKRQTVMKIDSTAGEVDIVPSNSELINGASNKLITAQRVAWTWISDGTQLLIIA